MATQASAQNITAKAADTAVSAVDAAVGSAFIASGIGSTVLGLMVVLAEASENFANSLKFVAPVGPLSGKTTIAVIAYLVSWVLLHFTIGKNIKLNTAFTITLVLIGLGFLMTFPPFFELFAPVE
jgi:hypothetical protein